MTPLRCFALAPAVRALAAGTWIVALLTISPDRGLAQQAQNPSPMVEHTREHPRLQRDTPAGRRETLELGTLFLPDRLKLKPHQTKTVPLLVVFHAGAWLPEVAAGKTKAAVITIQVGAGSGAYVAAFADARRFPLLLEEAERKARVRFRPITLAGWSAGCGAIRQLLRQPDSGARVERIIAIDGIHTDYVGGKPGPLESQLETGNLEPWIGFAREAMAGRRRLVITHSEIFPGTFASTTETADWLIRSLGLKRRAVVQWGPMRMQRLSDTRAGRLRIQGYAGNSAPDHVDQLHALPEFLRMVR
jgi:hypothetical protein